VEFRSFERADHASTQETQEVRRLAQEFHRLLEEEPARSQIVAAHLPTKKSQLVQEALTPAAKALGFVAEREGLFPDCVRKVRPDFYRPVADTGILVEVERGKTTTNNMDFADFWKCHLCPQAHYLFLFVPVELRHNDRMRPKREFQTVCRRLGPFFEMGHYTNVRGLYVFGYGGPASSSMSTACQVAGTGVLGITFGITFRARNVSLLTGASQPGSRRQCRPDLAGGVTRGRGARPGRVRRSPRHRHPRGA
jgi:hypothetical protein